MISLNYLSQSYDRDLIIHGFISLMIDEAIRASLMIRSYDLSQSYDRDKLVLVHQPYDRCRRATNHHHGG